MSANFICALQTRQQDIDSHQSTNHRDSKSWHSKRKDQAGLRGRLEKVRHSASCSAFACAAPMQHWGRVEEGTWAIVFDLVTFLPKTETSVPPTFTKLVDPDFSSFGPSLCECIRRSGGDRKASNDTLRRDNLTVNAPTREKRLGSGAWRRLPRLHPGDPRTPTHVPDTECRSV